MKGTTKGVAVEIVKLDLPGRKRKAIPLGAVASAIARWEATEHRPNAVPQLVLSAYEALERTASSCLLNEAKAGRLRVCRSTGTEASAAALIATGINVKYEDRVNTEVSTLFSSLIDRAEDLWGSLGVHRLCLSPWPCGSKPPPAA